MKEKEFAYEDSPEKGVTEIFITHVSPENQEAFQEWMGKIHEAEVKAVGFRHTYVQAPKNGSSGKWVTLLQFDTEKNLDRWMESAERKELLEKSKEFVNSFENHRVTTAFAGWFSSVAASAGVPAVWKQTMLVLLILYPIVMLEIKFLNPALAYLPQSIAVFIGNVISVMLISWPFMPIAIYFLYWWLFPRPEKRMRAMITGIALLTFLYLIEILLLSHLFD